MAATDKGEAAAVKAAEDAASRAKEREDAKLAKYIEERKQRIELYHPVNKARTTRRGCDHAEIAQLKKQGWVDFDEHFAKVKAARAAESAKAKE